MQVRLIAWELDQLECLNWTQWWLTQIPLRPTSIATFKNQSVCISMYVYQYVCTLEIWFAVFLQCCLISKRFFPDFHSKIYIGKEVLSFCLLLCYASPSMGITICFSWVCSKYLIKYLLSNHAWAIMVFMNDFQAFVFSYVLLTLYSSFQISSYYFTPCFPGLFFI